MNLEGNSMNNNRPWLSMVLIALTFTTVGRAHQSAGNRWETEIETFEEADRQDPPTKGVVLFIGSSTIRMWQSLAEDFPGIAVTNRGFGGSEIADSTFFIDRIVIPYRPKNSHPLCRG